MTPELKRQLLPWILVGGDSLAERKRSALENDLRHGLLRRVRQGKRNVGRTQLRRELGGLAVKDERGPSPGLAGDFNIAPAHPVIPPCPDCLHACFLGGEARCVPFGAIGLRLAVLNLAVGKNPFQEALAMALNRLSNPRNLG